MSTAQFSDLFRRLFTAEGQSRTARTVERFGWLIFVESASLLFFVFRRVAAAPSSALLRSPSKGLITCGWWACSSAAVGDWPLYPDSRDALRRLMTVAPCAAMTNSDRVHGEQVQRQLASG